MCTLKYTNIKKQEWQRYLEELDALSQEANLLALKTVVAVLYRHSVLYHNEEMFALLKQKQNSYFLNSNTVRKDRLMFGVALAKEWPSSVGSQFQKHFTESLELLFIEEAKEDLQYALKLFDAYDKNENRSYFFSFIYNSPVNILDFAREAREYRPLLFANALVNFIHHYNNESHELRGKSLCSSKLKVISNELYKMIDNKIYPEEFKIENALQLMIRYCSMDEVWYRDLFIKLWAIEVEKIERDKESLKNYFLIGINCIDNKALLEQVYIKFNEWAQEYKGFDVHNHQPFKERVTQMHKLMEMALYDNVLCYARSIFLTPNIEKKIVDDLIDLYWEMIGWIRPKNKILYFEILVQYVNTRNIGNTSTKQQEEILEKAKWRLKEEFKAFVKTDTEGAAQIISALLSRSSRSYEAKEPISELLNELYFMLEDMDKIKAKMVLDEELKKEEEHYKHYDRGGPSPWRPSYAASTPYASENLLVRLSQYSDPEIRKNVAKNIKTPIEILEKLSHDTEREVRLMVVQNPNTATDTLKMISQDGNAWIREMAYAHPNFDVRKLWELDQKGQKRIISHNPNLPVELITEYAKDQDESVRKHIAANPSTPADILLILSQDTHFLVCKEVAKNPNSPIEALEILSKYDATQNKRYMADIRRKNLYKKFKNFLAKIRYKISGDYTYMMYAFLHDEGIDLEFESQEIRRSVAYHASTPINILEKLYEDDNWHVMNAAKTELKRRRKLNNEI